MTAADSVCECCNTQQKIVGVACIPGMPMSIAWCEKCLNSGAIPYWAAVANTAMCGGLDSCNQQWRDLVHNTLVYHGKDKTTFHSDVMKDMENINNAL